MVSKQEKGRIQSIIQTILQALPDTSASNSASFLTSSDDPIDRLEATIHHLLQSLPPLPAAGIHQQAANGEERFRKILDTIEESYFEVDLKGNLLFFNDTVLRDLNYTADEIRSVHFRKLVDDKNARKVFETFHEVYLTGKTVKGFDWEVRKKDCGTIDVEASVALMRNEQGLPTGFRGIVRDISLRKQTEKRLKLITENIRDVIWTRDFDLNYTYVSPSIFHVTGFTADEIIKIPVKSYLKPEQYNVFRKTLDIRLREAQETGMTGPTAVFELEVPHKNGTLFWVEISADFNRDENGIPFEIVGVTRDITERKKAEAEKEKLENQLQQAQKMETVGRLAGGVAHDFNNMLNVILGYIDLAKLKLPAHHPILPDILEMEKAACRSSDLTAQLLAFSRKQIIRPQIIDLNRLIAESEKTILRLIGEHIGLTFHPASDLWPIKFDPLQAEQILINLAVNACDSMPQGGSLIMETANIQVDQSYSQSHPELLVGDYVMLTVNDTGCGIDQRILPYIFEPFFTTKEIGKGTGLGLATVYGILKQNNAFIRVHSESGQGSTFRIYLPRSLEAADIPDGVPEACVIGGSGSILLVEDDDMVIQMVADMLAALGYQTTALKNPLEALALCEQASTPVDLVITDVVMPILSGRELRDRLQVVRPDIKVLFMSGYTSDIMARQGILDEGMQFIQKPFSLSDLAAKVSALISPAKEI